jgi:outer membrane immunogenic protein
MACGVNRIIRKILLWASCGHAANQGCAAVGQNPPPVLQYKNVQEILGVAHVQQILVWRSAKVSALSCGGFMKKFLLVGCCALATPATSAMAADIQLKARRPPSVPISIWTGCYLGGSVGGIWRQTDIGIGVADGGSGAGAAAAAGAIPTAFGDGGGSFIAGGQAGCNYQAANWVFGIETDMSGTKLNGSQTIATNVPPFFPAVSSVSQDTNWIGTTRGRLGWAWGSVLLYGTGGVAYANMSYAYALSNVAGGGPVATAASDASTQLGWTAGGGLEVGFDAWSLKGEYLYYDLGNHTLTAACNSVIGGCTGLAPTMFSAHFRDNGSIARVGLNYRFY